MADVVTISDSVTKRKDILVNVSTVSIFHTIDGTDLIDVYVKMDVSLAVPEIGVIEMGFVHISSY